MDDLKFNFVINCEDSELNNYINYPPAKNETESYRRSDLGWCLQTYRKLLDRQNVNVQLTNHLIKDAINIIHSDQLLKLKGAFDNFIVCIKSDFPKRSWAHYHLVQNKNQMANNTSCIYFWTQPGLIKRDETRLGVRTVAYVGQTFNGNLAGNELSWKKKFKPYGIEFLTLPANSWHNLSSIDILIAIRSFDRKPYNSKPPTKLLNAWQANIPFIGGNDSAFKQVGTPGENYLVATTEQDVLNSVLKLKNDPELYNKLVRNGSVNAAKYNTQTISESWESILKGPVTKRYVKWKKNPSYEKILFLASLKIGIFTHEMKQIIKKLIR